MTLKERVEKELKSQNRSWSWLAGQLDKSLDELRMGLLKGSIKYNDLVKLGSVLGIRAGLLFGEDDVVMKERDIKHENKKTTF